MEFVAREIMTAPVITVGPEAKLAEAVKVMAEKNISGLPVVDEDNRVIGIISEADIVDYAGKPRPSACSVLRAGFSLRRQDREHQLPEGF